MSGLPRASATFGFALISGLALAWMPAGCAFGSDADAADSRNASKKLGSEIAQEPQVGVGDRPEHETRESSKWRSYRLSEGSRVRGQPLDDDSSEVRIRYDARTRTYALAEPKSFSGGHKHRECHPHGCEYFDDRTTVSLDELRFTVDRGGTLHSSLLSGTTTSHRLPLDTVSLDALEGSANEDELDLTLRDSRGSHRLILRPDDRG